MNHEQNQDRELTMNDAIGIVFLVCYVWALPTELMWRRWFGSRYIDGWLFAAALWPMFFAALVAPQYPMEWTIWAFWLVIAMGGYHNFVARWLDYRGVERHSQYDGQPYLCRYLPVSERTCKWFLEFVLGLAAAVPCVIISPSLMLFMAGSTVALQLKNAIRAAYQENLMTDLRDARLEQQALSRRLNDRRTF